MNRIAIIADIHANLFALESVISDLEERDIDEIIVAGDLVGRGPLGSDVVHRIDELGWPGVRGNHEDYLLSFCRRDVPDSWLVDEQWAASRWMARELDEQAIEFIDTLPFSLHSKNCPEIQVFHGSPNSHTEGLGHWTPDERLEELLELIDGSVLVCAHTHRPLHYEGDRGMIVNTGSVGLPFNGDWRAQYTILEGGEGDWDITFRRVEYPRQKLLDYYEKSGFLEEGKVTARLLARELRAARPFLVPFLKWAELTDHEPTSASLVPFLEAYDAGESMSTFFDRMREIQNRRAPS